LPAKSVRTRPLPQLRQGLQIVGAHGIGFCHNDPSALLDKARPLAVADARRKAEIYASAGGARIGRLMVLTEEAGRQMPVAFSRAFAAGAPAPTPIEAGEDKLTVTVTARFELTQ
jgi:uncharacterized protein